jgi:hypothetical protein
MFKVIELNIIHHTIVHTDLKLYQFLVLTHLMHPGMTCTCWRAAHLFNFVGFKFDYSNGTWHTSARLVCFVHQKYKPPAISPTRDFDARRLPEIDERTHA